MGYVHCDVEILLRLVSQKGEMPGVPHGLGESGTTPAPQAGVADLGVKKRVLAMFSRGTGDASTYVCPSGSFWVIEH